MADTKRPGVKAEYADLIVAADGAGAKTPTEVHRLTGIPLPYVRNALCVLCDAKKIRRVFHGEYAPAGPEVREASAKTKAAPAVIETPFIRPIPLHRLMGGR